MMSVIAWPRKHAAACTRGFGSPRLHQAGDRHSLHMNGVYVKASEQSHTWLTVYFSFRDTDDPSMHPAMQIVKEGSTGISPPPSKQVTSLAIDVYLNTLEAIVPGPWGLMAIRALIGGM